MLITTFVFIGIEGASVYSRYAKRREDVGKATVLGFLSVLSIFALVTLSSYSVVPQPELADTRQPSMVGRLRVASSATGARCSSASRSSCPCSAPTSPGR